MREYKFINNVLSMENQKLTDEDIEEIIQAIKKYPTILQLNLSRNSITAQGLKQLIPTINAAKIIFLNLSFNPITKFDFSELAATEMKEIDLAGMTLDDESISSLLESKNLLAIDLTREMNQSSKLFTKKSAVITKNRQNFRDQTISVLVLAFQELALQSFPVAVNKMISDYIISELFQYLQLDSEELNASFEAIIKLVKDDKTLNPTKLPRPNFAVLFPVTYQEKQASESVDQPKLTVS